MQDDYSNDEQQFVVIRDLAKEFGIDVTGLRRKIKNLGIEWFRVRSNKLGSGNNQWMTAITLEDAELVRRKRREFKDYGRSIVHVSQPDIGVFYAIELLPKELPGRTKFGFSTDAPKRLRGYKTVCPDAELLKAYPCMQIWEFAALAAVQKSGATHVAGEVYDLDDREKTLAALDAFFELLPDIED